MREVFILPCGFQIFKMKNSNLLIFTLMTLLSFSGKSQSHTLSGNVLDENREPVSFANVILKNAADSIIVKGEAANANGNFALRGIPSGDYLLEISSIGFQKFYQNNISLSADVNLGTIALKTNSNQLDEVSIIEQKALVMVQADKTVFNVQNDPQAAGSNGFEMLRKAPGLVIDNNDNLILEGKSGVEIFIDGKRSGLSGDDLNNYLQSLNASDIESIELITQPSAKYRAEGSAGIINIVFKKDDRLGTNGTLTGAASQGRYFQSNGGITLHHRNRATRLMGSYNINQGNRWSFFDFYRLQNGIEFDKVSITTGDYMSHNFRGTADHDLNDRHSIGLQVRGTLSDRDNLTKTTTDISLASNEGVEQILDAGSEEQQSFQNAFLNLNYRYQDTNNRTLSVDFDGGYFDQDRNVFQPNAYLDGETGAVQFESNFRMITPTSVTLFTAKTDYSQNLLSGEIGVGGEFSKVLTENSFDFFDVNGETETLVESQSNDFSYDEQVTAGYFTYTKKWQKWSVNAGLRGEQTRSVGELTASQSVDDSLVERNYFNLFPSGGATFSPSRTSTFALNYSRRIRRPDYQSLNPFEFRLDELSFRRGNPFLQPQYSHNIKLSHTYKYVLNTYFSYSHVSDFVAQITRPEGDSINILQPQNIATQRVISGGASYPWQITSWLESFFSINIFQSFFDDANPKFVSVSQLTASGFGQLTFKLKNGHEINLNGWASSPSIWGGTFQTKSLGALTLGYQKRFLEDRLTVKLAVTDIFFSSPWRAEAEFADLQMNGTGGRDSRRGQISVTYNFGNQKMQRVRERETGLDDESERLKSE